MPNYEHRFESEPAIDASIAGFLKMQFRSQRFIEHIIAIQHGGVDDVHNLALACDRRNAFKGPNLSTIDPISNAMTPLFNPRTETWSEHFQQIGYEIAGKTETGRATVRLLNMNARRRVQLRMELKIDLAAE